MKADDEITTTGGIAASSYCNAKLKINNDVVTISFNLRSYLFEWGTHLFCWIVCIYMSIKVWQLEPNLNSKTEFVIGVFTLKGLFSLVTTQIYTSERSLTCHELSILTTNQTRIVLMFHGDYYAIQGYSDILAKILGSEMDSLEA